MYELTFIELRDLRVQTGRLRTEMPAMISGFQLRPRSWQVVRESRGASSCASRSRYATAARPVRSTMIIAVTTRAPAPRATPTTSSMLPCSSSPAACAAWTSSPMQ